MKPAPERVNGIHLATLKGTVSAVQQDPELGRCKFRVRNQWVDANQNRTSVKGFYAAKQEMNHKEQFEMNADEPPVLAGGDSAPNPVEHLLNALATCVTTAMVAHAAVRGIEIHELESELEGDIDLNGFLGLNDKVPKGFQNIRVNFKVKSPETDMQKLKDLALYSPVYNSLMQGVKVDVQVQPK